MELGLERYSLKLYSRISSAVCGIFSTCPQLGHFKESWPGAKTKSAPQLLHGYFALLDGAGGVFFYGRGVSHVGGFAFGFLKEVVLSIMIQNHESVKNPEICRQDACTTIIWTLFPKL